MGSSRIPGEGALIPPLTPKRHTQPALKPIRGAALIHRSPQNHPEASGRSQSGCDNLHHIDCDDKTPPAFADLDTPFDRIPNFHLTPESLLEPCPRPPCHGEVRIRGSWAYWTMGGGGQWLWPFGVGDAGSRYGEEMTVFLGSRLLPRSKATMSMRKKLGQNLMGAGIVTGRGLNARAFRVLMPFPRVPRADIYFPDDYPPHSRTTPQLPLVWPE
jgi:hypothetical protein